MTEKRLAYPEREAIIAKLAARYVDAFHTAISAGLEDGHFTLPVRDRAVDGALAGVDEAASALADPGPQLGAVARAGVEHEDHQRADRDGRVHGSPGAERVDDVLLGQALHLAQQA